MTKPPSRASQARQAEKTLLALLRTPKTREGLVAAVRTKTISRNYVFGFLSAGKRSGALMTLKSGASLLYQVATPFVDEKPQAGEFPAWLEPRSLPTSAARAVYVDGVVVNTHRKEE